MSGSESLRDCWEPAWAGRVAGVFLLIYVFVPFAFYIPLRALHMATGSDKVNQAIGMFFYPLEILVEVVPAYGWYLDYQGAYLEKWFPGF